MTPMQRMMKFSFEEPTIKKIIKEANRRVRESISTGDRPETVWNFQAFKKINSQSGSGGEFEVNVLYTPDCSEVDMVCFYFDSFAYLTIDHQPLEFWSQSRNSHCLFEKDEWFNDPENPTPLEIETVQILFGADFAYVVELFDSLVETFLDENGMINANRVHIS